jgi:hypothetical protein
MEKQTRKRRTKKEIEASKGLGDTVEKVLHKTGIDKLAKFVLGEDCKCDKRKEYLNKMFPYNKPNCLLENEYEYLKEFFSLSRYELKPTQQQVLLPIYARVFNVRAEPTSCDSCWIEMVSKLKKVYENYELNN